MSTAIITQTRRSARPVVFGRLVLPAALLLVGILGHLVVPGGPARAIFVLPCLFWVPGRAIAAALGLGAKESGQFVNLLSVLFSCIALIVAGLLTNLVLGHVPLSTLPLWLSGILLPLNLLERNPVTGLRASLPGLRIAAFFTAAFFASGALLWGAVAKLPATKQAGYLTFYLSDSYTKLQGVLTAAPGQVLQVPLQVGGGGNQSTSGLTVATYIDGKPTGPAVPMVTTGPDTATAHVSVTVPSTAACEHQVRLILERGTSQLRAVDLYVQTSERGKGCGNG